MKSGQARADQLVVECGMPNGFAFEEATPPGNGGEELVEVAEQIASSMALDEFPHLAELATKHVLQPGYNFADSFAFGLDLLLKGIGEAERSDA